jgi:uncharacterized protein (DUF342 family)
VAQAALASAKAFEEKLVREADADLKQLQTALQATKDRVAGDLKAAKETLEFARSAVATQIAGINTARDTDIQHIKLELSQISSDLEVNFQMLRQELAAVLKRVDTAQEAAKSATLLQHPHQLLPPTQQKN